MKIKIGRALLAVVILFFVLARWGFFIGFCSLGIWLLLYDMIEFTTILTAVTLINMISVPIGLFLLGDELC